MKKYSFYIILLSTLALGMTACNTTKKIATPNASTPIPEQPKMNVDNYLAQKIDYQTFSGKAKMHYDGDGQSQDFTANIRMHKNKDIWTSITALGGILEVARAYITPERLKARNTMGRTYYDLSYDQGIALIKTEIPFEDLQNIFVGNPLMENTPVKSFNIGDSIVSIIKEHNDITQTLYYSKATSMLKTIELKAPKRNFNCTIQYSGYGATTNKLPFAYTRTIDIDNNGKKVHLDMNFVKADLNVPVEMNYSVPNSYQKGAMPK